MPGGELVALADVQHAAGVDGAGCDQRDVAAGRPDAAQAPIPPASSASGALTDGPVAGPDAARQVVRIACAALNTGGGPTRLLIVVIVLLVLVLTVMLLLTWMVRLGVLVVLAGIAPAALACHGLPQLDGVPHLW